MFRRVAYLAVVGGLGLGLAGCALSLFGAFEQRAAWHDDEERACMSSRVVLASASVTPIRRMNDSGACGILRPLKVSGTNGGRVTVGPTATLNCPMTATLEAWMEQDVQPAAIAWFGVPVVEIKQIASYSCRPINNQRGENLSQHSYGNALDVAAFTFADGRTVTVLTGWRGEVHARGFLHEIFAAACARFKTTLGPGEPNHSDHFHLDLAHHGRDGTSRYCEPTPDVVVPPRPPFGTDLIARGAGRLDATPTGSIPSSVLRYLGD